MSSNILQKILCILIHQYGIFSHWNVNWLVDKYVKGELIPPDIRRIKSRGEEIRVQSAATRENS